MPKMDRRRPNAALALADGTVFLGFGGGCPGIHEGELVFNTSITGYQEILTDPSYAGQIVTFTFPHIGNVGTNDEDIEALTPYARGMVSRAPITDPSNWRSSGHLDAWLAARGIAAIGGVDTRRITRILREHGAQNAALAYLPDAEIDLDDLKARAKAWPGLVGMDLAGEVSCRQRYRWDETPLGLGRGLWPQRRPGAARRGHRLRREAQHPAQPRQPRLPGDRRARDRHRRRGAGAGTRRHRAHQRPGRSGRHRRLRRARDQEAGRQRQAGVRHLPRPPDAGPGAGRRGRRRCRSAITAPTTRSRT